MNKNNYTDQLTLSLNKNPVKDVISKLRFLSKIKPGEKLNVKEYFVRDNNSIFQRILRSIRNLSAEGAESKDATLEFIEQITDETLDLICTYRAHSNNDDDYKHYLSDMLIKNLENSKKGIRNLFKTYEYDRIFVSRAEAILQTLDARIRTLKLDSDMKPDFEEYYNKSDHEIESSD